MRRLKFSVAEWTLDWVWFFVLITSCPTSTRQFPHLKHESVSIYSIYLSRFAMRLKLGDVCKHDLQKYKTAYTCTGFLLDVFLVRVNLICFLYQAMPTCLHAHNSSTCPRSETYPWGDLMETSSLENINQKEYILARMNFISNIEYLEVVKGPSLSH